MSNRAGNLAAGVAKFPTIPLRGSWAVHAACTGMDPDLWFVEVHEGNYAEARRVCRACPVRQPCLDWAVATNTTIGMFGGLAPRERKHLR